MTDVMLTLRGFGVSFGDQTILSDVTLDLPDRGLTSLVGPAAAGKSTLLRTLAGLNDAHPSLRTWGTAVFEGQEIHGAPRLVSPAGEIRRGMGMVVQHARFFLDSVRENLVSVLPNRSGLEPGAQTRRVCELLRCHGLGELVPRLGDDVASLSKPLQRRLAVVRALVSEPALLLADEPTAGLEEDDAIELLALLRVQARFRAILFVTHNQRLARAAGGMTALLAGGRIQELAPATKFFGNPNTVYGRSFVRTGGCVTESPRPPAVLEAAEGGAALLPVAVSRSRFEGPRGFFWVQPGRLGGLPRPGIVSSVEHDLAGLQRLGVSTLVTLEESATVDPRLAGKFGIELVHFPVVDMSAPALEPAARLCGRVERLIADERVVAMHCRAGLGRTGTLLACQLIWAGESAHAAVDRVRRLNPQCIQAQVQVDFLSAFEAFAESAQNAPPRAHAGPQP